MLPDDRCGEAMLTARLVAVSHRRIGRPTLREGMVATGLRLLGYRDALAGSGIALVMPCDFEGRQADVQLLRGTTHGMLGMVGATTA